jgi:hypothetical protein
VQSGGDAAEEESGGTGDEDTEATARDNPDKTEESQDGGELARMEFFGVQEAWWLGLPIPSVHMSCCTYFACL